MKPSKMIQTFNDKYPFVGPTLWILSIQYFLIQIVVAMAWKVHYSFFNNTISDLGNTSCTVYDGRAVCSPLHSLMNASFITLGVSMILGSMLIYHEFKKNKATIIGFSYMAIAGVGTLLVGLFPENTVSSLHEFGALLPFFVGNVGVVILGFALAAPRKLRIYTIITGVVSLVALGFFVWQRYLGLGIGGMERLTAYPQTLWLIVFGMYISRNHFTKQSKKQK